jgi:hypothetical protein
MTTPTDLATLRATMDRAVAARAAVLYAVKPGAPPAQGPGGPSTPPRDWDGQSPISHYGTDGHRLPEVKAYYTALRAR